MKMKYLMLALSALPLFSKVSPANPQDGTVEIVKKTIRSEVSAMGFKFLIGVVLVSTIVFAMIQSGYAFQTLLSQFENGLILELVVFSSVTVAGLLALYLLFKSRQNQGLAEVTQPPALLKAFELQNLVVHFVEGFTEGLDSSQKHRNSKLD
jgi:hypothetical protein